MQLNVPFSDIPERGVEFDIKDSSWFPDELGEPAGPVTVHIRLTKKNENRIELQGSLQVDVILQCDRCLEQYVVHIDSPMQLVVEVAEPGEHWRLHDIEPAGAELETIATNRPVVDLAELLREQLYLSLPEKMLCRENCAGLCPHCGTNLNVKDCGCKQKTAGSPFAVLESLKKK